ncbi:MAG: hypothetical protein AB7F89_05030 [Pirellulaceae bacterium]
MKGFSFSLLVCLALACLAGACLGMLARVPRYQCREGSCDGFRVQGMWSKRWGHSENFLYLVAYPDGDQHGGGATEWLANSPSSQGVSCHPRGVFVRGQRRDPPSGYGIWVYVPTHGDGDVRHVTIPPHHRLRLGTGDFTTLAESEMWKRYIRRALVEESVRWSEDFARRNGGYYLSRFPPRDRIDWEGLDALFVSQKPAPGGLTERPSAP